MVRSLESRKSLWFQLSAIPFSCYNSGKVVHISASVTKQYDTVLLKGHWCSEAGMESTGSLWAGLWLLPGNWRPRYRDWVWPPCRYCNVPIFYTFTHISRCLTNSVTMLTVTNKLQTIQQRADSLWRNIDRYVVTGKFRCHLNLWPYDLKM